jgi:lipopolysaccharide assembly protein A
MNFLKTLFWVILLVGLVVFAINNWEPVTVALWGGLRLDTKLPVLVIGSFFIGFLPLYVWHRGTHWRMKRRVMSLETAARPAPLSVNSVTSSPNAAPNIGGAI